MYPVLSPQTYNTASPTGVLPDGHPVSYLDKGKNNRGDLIFTHIFTHKLCIFSFAQHDLLLTKPNTSFLKESHFPTSTQRLGFYEYLCSLFNIPLSLVTKLYEFCSSPSCPSFCFSFFKNLIIELTYLQKTIFKKTLIYTPYAQKLNKYY